MSKKNNVIETMDEYINMYVQIHKDLTNSVLSTTEVVKILKDSKEFDKISNKFKNGKKIIIDENYFVTYVDE